MSPGHQATTSARSGAPAGIAEIRPTGLARLRDPRFLLSSARRAGRSSLMPAAAAGMLPGWPRSGSPATCRGVKLLVLLREPVERAYSGHAHEISPGFETEPFERALELEPGRLEGEVERILADRRISAVATSTTPTTPAADRPGGALPAA
jgi:hypothetical protein